MNVYDFDKTIFDGDSTRRFYFFALKKHPKLALLLPYQGIMAIPFALKLMKKTDFKERFYKFLKLIPDVDSLVSEFWAENECRIKRFYRSRKMHSDIIISASPEFLLEPICKKLGVTLIASKVDKHTGKYDGLNCYGEEKVNRFLERFPYDKIKNFYSDSLSDAPLALIAKKSYIVKGERLIDWRKFEFGIEK